MNIIVANHVPSKNNNVWVVFILGDDNSRHYCKSPYSAMKCLFHLKSLSTDRHISDNCLQRLLHEIGMQMRTMAEAIQKKAKEIADIYNAIKCYI